MKLDSDPDGARPRPGAGPRLGWVARVLPLLVTLLGAAPAGADDGHTWAAQATHLRPEVFGAPVAPSREPHSLHLLPGDPSRPGRPGEGWRLVGVDDVTPLRTGPDRDWAGLGRDTAFFFGYQIVSVAFLYSLPVDVNRWNDDDVSFSNWWENVRTPPVWDKDHWATNYLTHPYWGASYYIRARERGFGKLASFGYTAVLSTLYEYGPEAFFEIPSAQDLMVTPILGSLVGALIFEPIRNRIKAKPEFRWYDQAALIATDPLGTLNSVFERMLGIKSEILLTPSPPAPAGRAHGTGDRGRRSARPQGFSVRVDMVWE